MASTPLGRSIARQMGMLTGGPLGTGLVPRMIRSLDRFAQTGTDTDLSSARSALNRVDQALQTKSLARLPALDAARSQVSQLRSEMYGIRTKLEHDTRSARAQGRLLKAGAAHDSARSAHQTAREAYQKGLLKTPPAHLQPLMIQFLRDKASEAASVAQAAQAQFLSETEDMLKTPQNTTYIKDLKNYLGDEYEPLLSDALMFALNQTRDGHPPIYVPNVKAGRQSRSLSTHISTMTPEMFKSRALDITDSMNSMVLAMMAPYISLLQEEGGQRALQTALLPHGKLSSQLDDFYQRQAEAKIAKGRTRYVNVAQLKQALRDKQWVKISQKTGKRLGGVDKPDDFYVPKDLYENWEHMTGQRGTDLFNARGYQVGMKIFRGSVLYGPRHFVHVTIAGQMPMFMAEPGAIFEFAKIWPHVRALGKGQAADTDIIPQLYQRTPASYKTAEGTNHELGRTFQWARGRAYGRLFRQAADHLGRVNHGLEMFEDNAQMMFQSAIRLRALKRGEDPTEALEMGRRAVVNMDSASPFERTIMKQVMPFYSFTRFATLFLLRYPFDHPLRASFLASISNQAQEEWGTGLPMDMMDLFFIGPQHASGDELSVNLKNVNPFRSIANTFTLGGFLSSMNPAVQALASSFGVNTLSGSSEMYPEISYNAQTGDLQATRPSGDMWTAIENFVPEFSAIDARLGLSDNYRFLYSNDRTAFWRQMASEFNIPFDPSYYNIPQVRGKTALNLYKGAEQAVYNAKSSGSFSGDVSRYNLVPADLNGIKTELYTPAQVEAYWKQLRAQYAKEYPGVDVAALIPKQ